MIGVSARSIVGLALLGLAMAAQESAAADMAPAGGAPVPCVEVSIGNDRVGRLDCLNQQFRRLADDRPIQVGSRFGVKSPPTQLGLFNETAERERLGSNFGHSARPQRPPH